MISQAAISGMIFQIAFSFLFPLVLFVYFYKNVRFTMKPVLVGIVVFIVFSQILEKLLHVFMLQSSPETASLLKNPYLFAVYAALAAGIFEEVGRYLGILFLLRPNCERREGLAMGLGHGGIESILIGTVAGVQSLSFAKMLNNGTFDSLLAGKVPAEALEQLRTQLTDTPWFMYVIGGLERMPAVLMHIALSLVVLYGVRRGKSIFLLYAVVFHAVVDFFPALYQGKVLSIWIVESVVFFSGIASIVIIVKSKKWLAALR